MLVCLIYLINHIFKLCTQERYRNKVATHGQSLLITLVNYVLKRNKEIMFITVTTRGQSFHIIVLNCLSPPPPRHEK